MEQTHKHDIVQATDIKKYRVEELVDKTISNISKDIDDCNTFGKYSNNKKYACNNWINIDREYICIICKHLTQFKQKLKEGMKNYIQKSRVQERIEELELEIQHHAHPYSRVNKMWLDGFCAGAEKLKSLLEEK